MCQAGLIFVSFLWPLIELALNNGWRDLMRLGQFLIWNRTVVWQDNIFQNLQLHIFFLFCFWGVCSITTNLPIFLFCFMRKCGVHISIIVCIDNEWIYFQLLMEFQSPGNKMNCYNKPNYSAEWQNCCLQSGMLNFFFQISVFNWFCKPLLQIFLHFAIKDCIAPFPSPDNIKISP